MYICIFAKTPVSWVPSLIACYAVRVPFRAGPARAGPPRGALFWGLCVVLFMQATSIVLAYISRDTLFVKTFGKDYIPYCILCISAVSGSVLEAYAECSKKYGLRVVASCSYFVFAAFFCVIRLMTMCVPTLRT